MGKHSFVVTQGMYGRKGCWPIYVSHYFHGVMKLGH